jgi:hypothetical protein
MPTSVKRIPKSQPKPEARLSPRPLRRLQEDLLEQIALAARHCRELEARFAEHPAPALETIIKLHRTLVFSLCVRADGEPELAKLLKDLMKSVMDYAQLEEKRRQRDLAEQKYRDQVEAQKAARAREGQPGGGALTPETLGKIERELNLF